MRHMCARCRTPTGPTTFQRENSNLFAADEVDTIYCAVRNEGKDEGIADAKEPMYDFPHRSANDLGPAWLLVANAAASDVAGASGAEACASRNAYTPMSQVLGPLPYTCSEDFSSGVCGALTCFS
jgi:hypothetical protein